MLSFDEQVNRIEQLSVKHLEWHLNNVGGTGFRGMIKKMSVQNKIWKSSFRLTFRRKIWLIVLLLLLLFKFVKGKLQYFRFENVLRFENKFIFFHLLIPCLMYNKPHAE